MFINLFNDEWLVSKQAVKLFLISMIFVVGMTAIFFGQFDGAKLPTWEQIPLGVEGALGSLSAFFLWFGMWKYWMRLDSSDRFLKGTSFLLLLFGIWFGAVPYYFFVYRPQVAGRSWAGPASDEQEVRYQSPRWGLRKIFKVGMFLLFGLMLIFGFLVPILLRKVLSKGHVEDYSTILMLALVAGIISFFAYLLIRLFRTGMKTHR
jgi:hypothetical protein